jgi:hypothetical protein
MSQESNYSVSFKTSRGTLITVRGDGHEELITNLAMASVPVGPDGTTALEMIGQIDAALAGGAASSGGQQSQGSQQTPPAAPQGSLSPKCETCGGETLEKNGTSKRGPWRGYFCQVNKDHPVKWA